MKKKNQELEKFKFVLDYKISELKKVIEPRETQIKEKNEQIQQMESELERISKSNEQLDLDKRQLRQKLKATDHEMRDQRTRVCYTQNTFMKLLTKKSLKVFLESFDFLKNFDQNEHFLEGFNHRFATLALP